MGRSVSYQTVGVVAISSLIAGFTLATYGANAYRRRKAEEEKAAAAAAAAAAQGSAGPHTARVGEAHPAASLPEHRACVYLDYNATTPVFPEVTAAIYPFISTSFGNPSSPHVFAAACRQAVETARDQVGRLINAAAPQKTIYFTSCGSESDNRAVDIALHHYHKARSATPRVVTCAVEHPAVLLYLRHLQDRGAIHLVVLGVDDEGRVSPTDVRDALTDNTALVTIMHSNNEVGTLQPVREVARQVQAFNAAKRLDILVHSDAAQSLGKVAVNVQHLGVDLLTVVGHKYGCPKGVAALYMREGVHWCPMLVGGGQERGLRAGTENVALIAGLGEASRLAREEADALLLHMLTLKRQLIAGLRREFRHDPGALRFNGPAQAHDEVALGHDLHVLRLMVPTSAPAAPSSSSALSLSSSAGVADKGDEAGNGHSHGSHGGHGAHEGGALSAKYVVEQLPNTVSVSFRGLSVAQAMPALQGQVACSAGSACHSEVRTLSPVLEAMRVPPAYGMGTLRLSWGRHTTAAEVDKAVAAISAVVRRHRSTT